jgi:hypothetical protein
MLEKSWLWHFRDVKCAFLSNELFHNLQNIGMGNLLHKLKLLLQRVVRG